MDSAVTLADISVSYGATPVLKGIDLVLPRGQVTVLAGPNGCGKSTLLATIRRMLRPSAGMVAVGQDDIMTLSERQLARRMALLAQHASAPDELSVFELVKMGRFPHQGFLRQWTDADARAVEAAVEATDLAPLLERRLDTLSGGQRQRVWLAMVLAQDTPIICLDEPINHLDVAHQLQCLDLVRRLNRDMKKTVVVVLHDLNLSARYADFMVLLKDGRVQATGTPDDLVTEATVREVFGIDSRVISDPVYGRPLCIPLSARP
ncbi:ABC transporter [Caenispirillum salinarum AK4]|uniref:ABC transporter n=1 Tax=Caenispirillum salinarum AK4 TaxID=1238182 RepID=K9HUF2_9PROT|nr:ABC transporter ATP-binding protein [Caenispirillum salinarum]EKV31881.1 ABC transporter [Caenispirillum salinarum AK4]